MPNQSTGLHTFSVVDQAPELVAEISPSTQDRVIGAIIKLNGRSSRLGSDEDVSYVWSVEETPLGSTVTSTQPVEPDGGVVTFVPDVTGRYTIGLRLVSGSRQSNLATATVDVTALLAPYTLRTTPDGSVMFKLMSSFWRLVERNEVFSTVWSGYMQLAGSDLLRAFQVDRGKSIRTIQPLFQRRWLEFEPQLDLSEDVASALVGNHQQGTKAYTESGAVASVGVIVSATEVRLLDGKPSLDALNATLRVFTSQGTSNPGSYTIKRLNGDETGYQVDPGDPIPAPEDEVLHDGDDLVTFVSDREVYAADVSVNFASDGVVAGDVLRIKAGSDSGYYRITKVGVGDGLPNERTLELDRAPLVSRSGRDFVVLKAVRIYAVRDPVPQTRTVFIPLEEADLDSLRAPELKGTGTIEGTFEIRVNSRHVFPSLVGQRIQITSGLDGGRSLTITGVSPSGSGYLLGGALRTSEFPTRVSYSIPEVSQPSDRLLVLEDRAYPVLSVQKDETGVASAAGGSGPVWAVTLQGAAAPSGRRNMAWRVASTLTLPERSDLEREGVAAGDLLVFEVTRTDQGFVSFIPCYVLGASGSRVSFLFGASLPEDGEDGGLSDDEILQLCEGLNIPRAEDTEDGLQLSLTAEEIRILLGRTEFRRSYFNTPLTPDTEIDLGAYRVRLRPSYLIRNCRIRVDDALVSVPSLFEYIDEASVGSLSDGTTVLVGKDGRTHAIDRAPVDLIENRDYSLSSHENLEGSNLQTTADSSTFQIPQGDLIDRDVRTGDILSVESGFDQGEYIIQEVLSSSSVRARQQDGSKPQNSATRLRFTIKRRVRGNFLRFVDGMYTAAVPAPRRMWAQTSLFDNSDYIEDNFGVLVNTRKEQLDRFGVNQVSYKGAVEALMFAWTMGPTLRNVAIGCSILTGLPTTEVPGQIIQIDPDYDESTNRGRVLIEDVDSEGRGTGLVRSYFYSSLARENVLNDFAGLSINPETGNTFAVGDYVPAFTPLSKAVLVSDYVQHPQWWRVAGASGQEELEKFHTWEVQVDVQTVDSRDAALVYEFCLAIRPIYTSPKIVLTLYLVDEVRVEDDLSFESTLHLFDDPVLSVEETHMVDSFNGSSLVQRISDFGSFATRTLFEGRDLVTTAGSGSVSSARGGFSGTLDASPLAHAPSEPMGVLSSINKWFDEGTFYRGTPLVQVGDILFIREGVNRGRYRITAVSDDSTLTITQLDDWPPRTRPIAEIEAAEGQVFQIQRQVSADITSGSGATVDTYDGSTDTTVIEDTDGNFRWQGAAVGDLLIVETGADYGVHEILEVGEWSGGEVVNPDTKLTVSGELTEAGTFAYTVRREFLRTNPLLSRTDGVTTASSDEITSATGGLLLQNLRYGDLLIPSSGSDSGKVFTVVDVLDDTTVLVDAAFSASESSVEFIVARASLFEFDGRRDGDWELERLSAYDDVSLVLVEPLSSVVALTDLEMTAGESTAISATDMAAAGVTAGMKLEIDNAHSNTGTYTVAAVSGTTVTIEEKWPATESAVSGEFFESASNWSLLDDTATLTAPTTNLEFGPATSTTTPESSTTFTNGSNNVSGSGTTFESTVEVGDVVRLSGDGELAWAVVTAVTSDTALTLDRNYTGTGGSGDLEIGVMGGMVLPGDAFEADTVGVYTIKSVSGNVLTLSRDTGVSPAASHTGRVTRRTR